MKYYIVTGAGSGMGRATAELLAQQPDVRIILIGRNEAALEQVRKGLAKPELHISQALDVRDAQAWKALFTGLGNDLNLCGVFANAGIGGENHYGPSDTWDEILSINLTGTYITIMEALPYLKKSTDTFKHIVITSSCLARFGVPNYTAYCTAKTGLLGLTRSLAVQLGSDKILVNALCPGWVDTEMAQASIQRLADREGIDYASSFNAQMSMVPLQRITQPAEIASMVQFLFSNMQTSITGQAIDINNGSVMM